MSSTATTTSIMVQSPEVASANGSVDDCLPSGPLKLPSLMIGGAIFSHHYNADTSRLPTASIISRAFSNGPNALDTSPYYGDSESIIGSALQSLGSQHPRSSYTLITKCGRLTFTRFDYSSSAIRASVLRSLQRLRTSYLDVVLLHDAEFVSPQECVEAMSELQAMQDEGMIRACGISGYTLEKLLARAEEIKRECKKGPEVLFSYCHYNLQNDMLVDYAPRFRGAGVKHIINGSPLSMGLLRAEPAQDWHPAPPSLKEACRRASETCEEKYGQKLVGVALRFAMRFQGTTCSGCSSLDELDEALKSWRTVEARKEKGKGDEDDEELFEELRRILVRDDVDMTWAVPPVGWQREM